MLGRNEVEHNSRNVYFRSPIGAAEAGSKIKLGIRLRTCQSIQSVLMRGWHDRFGEKLFTLTTKDEWSSEEKYYSITLDLPEKGCLLWYYFIITTADDTCYYGNNPEQLGGLGEVYDHVPPSFQITVYNKGAKTPDWFKHSVMYQIFPDRFYRTGERIIPKKGAVYHADWSDDEI